MIEFLKIVLFCVTFYFTILQVITWTKLFSSQINTLNNHFGLKNNLFITIIELIMWWYQIYFWFHLLRII